ncbi:MAG: hypothetical protein ACK4YP_07345, partial [Myxococcota bacterium]
MRDRVIVGVVAAVSLGHAVGSATGVTAAGAPGYGAALEAADAWVRGDVRALVHLALDRTVPGALAVWSGLWLAALGTSTTVAVASLLPFHELAADGLWRGGKAVGGTSGAAWALLGGLGAAGVLAAGADTRAAFPLFACVAYAVGAGIERRWARAAGGAVAAVVFGAGEVTVRASLLDVVGPALGIGAVAALLLRGNAVTLGLVAASAVVTIAAHFLDVDAAVAVPFLALAGAAAAATPWAAAGLGALALAQIVGFHTDRAAWPGRPAALRGVVADTAALDPVLDWLA